MSWGKGGMVGVGKAIYAHQRMLEKAALILEAECGKRHELGSRADLCPKCQDAKRKADRADGVTP